jgi:hypothetical protein
MAASRNTGSAVGDLPALTEADVTWLANPRLRIVSRLGIVPTAISMVNPLHAKPPLRRSL